MSPSNSPNPITISVVIPAYNAAAFIGQTLDSVMEQRLLPNEIIVVDDGSTDQTSKIVEHYANKHNCIQLIQQDNLGVGAARNTGIAACTSEWIALLDADDLWFPDKLQKQAELAINSSSNIGLIYCWSVLIDEYGKIFKLQGKADYQGNVWGILLTETIVTNTSVPLIRKSAIEKIGGFECFSDTQVTGSEDQILYQKLAEHYQFSLVPEYLSTYRIHSDNMSSMDENMDASFNYQLSQNIRRFPSLPSYVSKIAKSNYYYYRLVREYISGNYTNVLRYLPALLWADPAYFFRTPLWRMSIKATYQFSLSLINRRSSPCVNPNYIKEQPEIFKSEIPKRAAQIPGHMREPSLFNLIYRLRIKKLSELSPKTLSSPIN